MSCRSCQINRRQEFKYGHLLPKTVISNCWQCLFVNLIGPYTLKGKDNLQIDFMALTMIYPASSWFEIVELSIITQLRRQTVSGKELLTANKIVDKTSYCIAWLVNKIWLCRYPRRLYLLYDNRSEFKLHFEYICKSFGIQSEPTTDKNPKANAILERVHQVLRQMLCTELKLIWPNQLLPMTSMSFLTMRHGQFALPITQYSKPNQMQPYLNETCLLTFRPWLTGTQAITD